MTNSLAIHEHGVKLFRKNDYSAALEKFQEALSLAGDDPQRSAQIYNDMGVTYSKLDDFEAAHQALDEAMNRFVELTDTKGQAQTIGNRATVFEAEEAYDEAIEHYKQSATMLEEVGESDAAMYVWQAVSRLRLKQKEYIAAIGAYEEGIEAMPERSLKRKMLQKILKIPGGMMGNFGKW